MVKRPLERIDEDVIVFTGHFDMKRAYLGRKGRKRLQKCWHDVRSPILLFCFHGSLSAMSSSSPSSSYHPQHHHHHYHSHFHIHHTRHRLCLEKQENQWWMVLQIDRLHNFEFSDSIVPFLPSYAYHSRLKSGLKPSIHLFPLSPFPPPPPPTSPPNNCLHVSDTLRLTAQCACSSAALWFRAA